MLKSYSGFVCLALALASNPVFAQQEPSASAPIQEAESSSSAQSSEHPPFPIVVVETPEQAAHGSERETQSDKHDAEDLLAQQQAASAASVGATAADRQVIPAYWQAILATAGAIGLFWTIFQTRSALRLARESNELARLNAQTELRAWIGFKEWNLTAHASPGDDGKEVKRFQFNFVFENNGSTPALSTQILLPVPDTVQEPTIVAPKGVFAVVGHAMTPEEILAAHGVSIPIRIRIEYRTVFKDHAEPRATDMAFHLIFKGLQAIDQIKAGQVGTAHFNLSPGGIGEMT